MESKEEKKNEPPKETLEEKIKRVTSKYPMDYFINMFKKIDEFEDFISDMNEKDKKILMNNFLYRKDNRINLIKKMNMIIDSGKKELYDFDDELVAFYSHVNKN